MRALRCVVGILVFIPVVVAMGQKSELPLLFNTLRAGNKPQQLAAIECLAGRTELQILDVLLPILKGNDGSLKPAAAKAYVAVPRNFLSSFPSYSNASKADELQRMSAEYQALFKTEHGKLLELGTYVLPVLDAEKRPDSRAKRKLLLELLANPDWEDWDFEIDETHPGVCGNYDHSSENAIARLVSSEWRFAIQLLRTGGSYQNSNLFKALRDLKHKEIRSTFLALLRDRKARNRAEALMALSDEKDVETLVAPSLKDPYAVVRQHVIYALERRRTPGAWRMLLDLAFDPIERVRTLAQYELKEFKEASLESYAVKELRSRRPGRSVYAAELLDLLDTPMGNAELEKTSLQAAHPARAVALQRTTFEFNERTDGILAAAILDVSSEVVANACYAVGNLGRQGFRADMERLARSKDERIASAATNALESLRRES